MGNRIFKMKLTYILLLSAIIGLAFAQTNSPEASKCRKATAAGKCELCPTAGDTAGGPRKLNATSNTCADVRSATTEQVAAAGATNVHHYGLMEGVGATMTYTQPTFAAAWGVTWYPNESTLFTCKDTYMAVYKSTLVTSLCVLANTIIDTSAAVATMVAGAGYSFVPPNGGTPAGSLEFLPASQDCVNWAMLDDATASQDSLTCGKCKDKKVLYSGAAAARQTCSAVTDDVNCTWWHGAADNAGATATCGECAEGYALLASGATVAASCSAQDATKLASCYKVSSGTTCGICNWNAWMNGSGVCITSAPASTTKAAGLMAFGIAALTAVMMLN